MKPGVWLRWLAVVLLAVGAVVTAHARDKVGRTSEAQWLDQLASSARLNNSNTGRGAGPTNWKAAADGAFARGTKELPWPGKAGANNLAAWKAKATGRDLAKALMNPGTAVVTLLGGMVVKQLLDLACVRVFGGTLEEGAVWEECKFKASGGYEYATRTQQSSNLDSTGWKPSPQSACDAYAQSKRDANPTYTGTFTGTAEQTEAGTPGKWRCKMFTDAPPGFADSTTYDGISSRASQALSPDGYGPPAHISQIEDKITETANGWCQADFTAGLGAGQGNCAAAFAEVTAQGIPVEVDEPTFEELPNHVDGNCYNTKLTQPNGDYTINTTCTGSDYDSTGNTVQRKETKTETKQEFNADGTPKAPPATTTTETTDSRTACEKEPNSAECASASGSVDVTTMDGTKKADDVTKPLRDFVKDPKAALPTFPTLNWAFVLPSGCTAIALPAFDPWLQEIDICPYVDLFHTIMSAIWIMGGLFGAISVFWRNTFSQG